jgi:hypothetical protein
MSALVVDTAPARPVARPLLTARGRLVAAAVLVLGPLLQVIEFALESPPADTAARVATWVADPDRIGLAMAAGLLAVPFLVAAAAIMVAVTRGRSPRLAWVAGGLMTVAVVGLSALHGVEIAAYGLARAGHMAAATAVLDAGDVGLPGAVLLVMFLGCAVPGLLLLTAALWRSPLAPRMAAVCLLAFGILDIALGQGVIGHVALLVSFGSVAWALVTGYERQPRGQRA